jgi:hypothetical protein
VFVRLFVRHLHDSRCGVYPPTDAHTGSLSGYRRHCLLCCLVPAREYRVQTCRLAALASRCSSRRDQNVSGTKLGIHGSMLLLYKQVPTKSGEA